MQQRTLLASLHFTTKENASPFADYSAERWPTSIASFTKQVPENGIVEEEAKTTSSENSTLAAPAAKGNLMSLSSKMTLMMMSH